MTGRLNTFLGIDFGSSKEIVLEKIKTREGSILDTENSDDDSLIFNGVKFAGKETSLILFLFIEDKFSKASVYFKTNLESQTVNLYYEIQGEINDKYYKTEKDYELYDYPYEQNDGYTESAISLGKATFESYWNFPDPIGILEDYISLKINENHYIILTYEDGDLTEKMVNKIKSENSEDY